MAVTDFPATLSDSRIIELSHILEENMPVYPTHARFAHNVWSSLALGDDSTHYQIIVHEHNGTHVDVPSHFVKGGTEVDQMGAECFMGPCVTMDFTDIGENGHVTREQIIGWEQAHGAVRPGDIVLFNLGWAKYWRLHPDDYSFCHNWPGLSREAAEYLVERQVKMVGVDTMSVDAFDSAESPAHNALLPNRVLIAENLANLDRMPLRAFFIGLPLRIRHGSGGPVRAIGLIGR